MYLNIMIFIKSNKDIYLNTLGLNNNKQLILNSL